MADNFVANVGSGGDTFAADDIGGTKFPRSKIVIGADGFNDGDVSASNPLPVTGSVVASGTVAVSNMVAQGLTNTQLRAAPLDITGIPVGYTPGYSEPAASVSNGIPIDPSGQVSTRGIVMTDEGTFRINFANSSLAVSIGSVTISGTTVTGTGFTTADVHLNDYIKLDADGESAWVQVDSVDSDTQLTLVSAYVGGSSGAASRALVKPSTGSGGSISVASGQATIASGTTNAAETSLTRFVDIAPLVFRSRLSVSQRIANQTTYVGGSERGVSSTAARWFARFKIDGTTNTTVICETGRNPTGVPSASETESTTITLPDGVTTAVANEYRVEILTESIRFYINGINVATHTRAIPSQHDEYQAVVAIVNGTGAASTTSLVCDYITGKNHNKVEMGVFSDTEQIVAVAVPLKSYAYNVAGVIAINTDLITIDCSQLRSLYIQCTSMGTAGVVTVQWANDAAFTAPITATLLSEAGATSTTFNAAVMRVTNVIARYCRLRLTTATTAGTTTINVWGAQTTYTPIVTTQPVSGTVTATVTGYPTAAASADALANPTVTKIDATTLNFNGTSWDRARNNALITMGDTGAKTATFNGATQTNYNARGAYITVAVGAVTGTTPTLACQLQVSYDGTNFINLGPASANITTSTQTCTFIVYPTNLSQSAGATPANLTTGANQTIAINAPLPRTWRIVYTIGGTTPSFTLTNAYAAYVN